MVAWLDYKAAAQKRGSLALEWYVVISTPVVSAQLLKEQLPAHLAYQSQLEENGSLAFAGPLSDPSGDEMQGMGMIVYQAESLDAARVLAEADPMHASGARKFTLQRWLVNEGGLSLNIKLSAQKISL